MTKELTNSDDATLSLLIERAQKYTPLKDKEVEDLIILIRQGDMVAREKLINHNLRFVMMIAKRYRFQGVDYLDLINSGVIGLIKAADKYEYRNGVKFLSYAVYAIRRCIINEIADMSRCFKIPHHIVPKVIELRARVLDGETLDGDDAMLYMSIQRATSLDAPLNNDGDDGQVDCLLDHLSDGSSSSDGGIMSEEVLALINTEMSRVLDDRDISILNAYFGFDDIVPASMGDISKSIGLTRQRVSQIIETALKKLKNCSKISKYYKDNKLDL